MATAQVICISSSPVHCQSIHTWSSSPGLPSLSPLYKAFLPVPNFDIGARNIPPGLVRDLCAASTTARAQTVEPIQGKTPCENKVITFKEDHEEGQIGDIPISSKRSRKRKAIRLNDSRPSKSGRKSIEGKTENGKEEANKTCKLVEKENEPLSKPKEAGNTLQNAVAAGAADSVQPTKHRQIDIVDFVSGRLPSVENGKAAKHVPRRLRTVTAASINQFRLPKSGDRDVTSAHPIASSAMPQARPTADTAFVDAVVKAPSHAERDLLSNPGGKQKSSCTKATSKTKKKVALAMPRLPSPETAVRKINRQEFLFGTSSQLIMENSPSFISELREALKKSEMAEAALDMPGVQDSVATSTSSGTGRRLWNHAARGEDDYMLPPTPSRNTDLPITPEEALPLDAPTSDFADIDAVLETSAEVPKVSSRSRLKLQGARTKRSRLLLTSTDKQESPPGSTERAVLQPVPPNRITTECAPEQWTATAGAVNQRPRSRKTQASKNPKSEDVHGIAAKACKSRPCAQISSSITGPTSKKIAKCERTTEEAAQSVRKEWTTIEEIEDSEPDPISSPPRRQSPSQVPPLELFKNCEHVPTVPAKPSAAPVSAALFSHIMKAVKSLPRSTDTTKPNWHEKMLMYDPIVLEDLTAWLNDGALKDIGWVGEGYVKPSVVQKWCEENSVCCLWREGLRGGVKAKY